MKIKQMIPLFITDRLDEVKSFYTEHLRFKVTFDSERFLSLQSTEESGVEISFMPSEDKSLRNYQGGGMMLCLEVDDVDAEYERLTKEGVRSNDTPKDHPWGDRSFWIDDPLGVTLYIYKTIPASKEVLSSM